MTEINLYDTIVLTENLTTQEFMNDKSIILNKGLVGTIVDEYNNKEAFEVEFADDDGQTYALLAIPADKLMKIYFSHPNLVVTN